MKKQEKFSNFEVFIIVRELNEIITEGFIENVYEIEDLLLIKISTKKKGKINLMIQDDSRVNITEFNYPVPKYPNQFTLSLRKFLKNKKILSISQHDFDRIIVIELEGYENETWKFIIELFNKGNYLLLSPNNKIKVARSYKIFKDRKVLANKTYEFPPSRGLNFLTINKEAFYKTIKEKNDEIVRLIARNVGVSGMYSEELCLRAQIDKKLKGIDLNEKQLEKLYTSLKNLRNQLMFGELKPQIILDENNEEIAVVPFDLLLFKEYDRKYYETFNKAVDVFYSKKFSHKNDSNISEIDQKIQSLQKVLKNQEEYLEELKNKKEKYYILGDFIYANFNKLQKLFNVILEAKKKGYSWQEINNKLISAKKENFEDLFFFERIIPQTRQLVIKVDNNEILLNLHDSVGENANKIYSKGKKAEKKIKGTIDAILETKKKIEKLLKEKDTQVVEKFHLIKKPKKKWYEKFHWFHSSDGFLIIGGRDASTNELIFKRYLEKDDLVFHTNFPGSPLVVIKNPEKKEIPQSTIKEAADFVASYSRAWKENWGVVDVFYVKPNQVSKSPPSGEYLPKGSFMIMGKKNFIRDAKTELAIGIYFEEFKDDLEPDKTIFLPRVLCGPPTAIRSQTPLIIIITPTKNGLTKGKLAKEIINKFHEKLDASKRKWLKFLDMDELLLYLPSGTSIIQD